MQNLVPVLDALGKTGEAQALQRRVASIEPHPPFYFFKLGKAALNAGNFKQAKALFEREVARAPYNDEFHFWLAIACLNLGEEALARKQLALAVDASTTEQMRGVYSSKLAQLAIASQAQLILFNGGAGNHPAGRDHGFRCGGK
jgi:tetratricopeptide (TPR) repeat protein